VVFSFPLPHSLFPKIPVHPVILSKTAPQHPCSSVSIRG
jgi:hypothetical protein